MKNPLKNTEPKEYRPDKKVRIKRGLFAGEIMLMDEEVYIKGERYFKLKGSQHFWKPKELELV